MNPQLFQILFNADDTFWWHFIMTFVHYSPESEWFPMIEADFGNNCACKLSRVIRDTNTETNVEQIPQMKVSDVLFFMDCEAFLSEMPIPFIPSEKKNESCDFVMRDFMRADPTNQNSSIGYCEILEQNTNGEMDESIKHPKNRKIRTYNHACKKCGKIYRHSDAVRKHARQKHPEWIKTCKGPKQYIIDTEKKDDILLTSECFNFDFEK